ncbi:MAG TPA: hypothetical protein K8V48_05895 [Limosilactobacillus oris]|uniref:hypothetical protein n=1 Tax=Limosilactobacillus oris TaxID=1632 RepID=UPI001D854B10|nr:hypothetical protein [Limosilactobacillus oris]HJF47491.1 hypothetical protein [Limosilactobacillus oris]
MPKQGQFAKSTRTKQLNSFKVKRRGGDNTIPTDQLTDFLVVRFALTAKKRVAPTAQETVQRFLIELANRLVEDNGNLVQLVPPLLTKLNSQVPWQFYAQLTANWDLLQRFLVKELPAVPLAQRLRVTTQLSTGQLNQLVAEQLAQKGAAATLLGRGPLPPAQTQLVAKQLLAALYRDGQVDWQQVRALLAPLLYQPAADLDLPTRQWLTALAQQPGLTGAN